MKSNTTNASKTKNWIETNWKYLVGFVCFMLIAVSGLNARVRRADANQTIADCQAGPCSSSTLTEALLVAKKNTEQYFAQLWFEDIIHIFAWWLWWIPAAWDHPYMALMVVAGVMASLLLAKFALVPVYRMFMSKERGDDMFVKGVELVQSIYQQTGKTSTVVEDGVPTSGWSAKSE
jgi:hypothetical protein